MTIEARAKVHSNENMMNESNNQIIFKILNSDEWNKFQETGVFNGSEVDLKDGFIHFSSDAQVTETANKHFAHLTEIWLLKVDVDLLEAELKWEPSRGGDLFPHLYGTLPLSAVIESRKVVANSSGEFDCD